MVIGCIAEPVLSEISIAYQVTIVVPKGKPAIGASFVKGNSPSTLSVAVASTKLSMARKYTRIVKHTLAQHVTN
jgi:hypothetical protein